MGKGLLGDRGERISIGKGGKRSYGKKGEDLRGDKALGGKRGERISTGKGGNIFGRKTEKISGGKGLRGDLNRERGAKILEGKGGKGTIPKGRK